MKKINKAYMGMIAIGLFFAINSLNVTQADTYTEKDGTNLKTQIVEKHHSEKEIGANFNNYVADAKTNLLRKTTDLINSNVTKETELKLQNEFLAEKAEKEKAAAIAKQKELEEQQRVAKQQELEKQKIAANNVPQVNSDVLSHLNATFKNSLAGYAGYFYNSCLNYGVNPYLAAAITLFESNHGKSALAVNNHNIGGMRSRSGWMYFATIEEGIDAHIRNLANGYINLGMTTPESMVNKYAEGSPSWVTNINRMMAEIAAA